MRPPIEPVQTSFIEEAVTTWGDTVYRVALSHTGSPDEADDIYQEVFERLLEASRDFASSEHLKAWLIRVTINRCHDHQKAHSHSRTDSIENHLGEAERKLAADPEADASADEFSAEMIRALLKLPDDQRTAVGLFYQRELSTAEIADVTGTTPGAVRTQLYRARRTLRRLLATGAALLAAMLIGLAAINGMQADDEVAASRRAPAAINFFALRAWADPNTAPTTVTPSEPLGVGWLHPQYWDPNYNPEDPFEEGPVDTTGIACTTFNFDALCVGANLASISYEVTCPDAWLMYRGADQALEAYREPSKRVVVDYTDQVSVRASADLAIEVVAPLSADLAESYESATQSGEPEAYWSEIVPAGFIEAAAKLEGSELILTATFTDGSTERKAYRIALAPHFGRQSQLLVRDLIEQWGRNDGVADNPEALPALLILEPLS